MDDPYEHVEDVFNLFYIPQSIPGRGCPQDIYRTDICDCHSGSTLCTSACHTPLKSSYILDEADGVTKLATTAAQPVFECHSLCRCDAAVCGNRLVSKGPVDCLEVRATCNKGLGLFTKKTLDAFVFVCEYAGEYIGKEEAERRYQHDRRQGNCNYILCVHEHFEGLEEPITTRVDPSRLGNVGRYANHSCNANTTIVPVRVDSWRLPRLALFTVRTLEVDEEITFDYGTNSSLNYDHKEDLVPCHCGESQCRGFLPFHSNRDFTDRQ